MDPITLGAIGIPALGGLLGNLFGSSDRDKAIQAKQAALQQILGVQLPDIDKERLALQQYQSAGQLSPEMENALAQQQSQMNSITTDPRLKDAQMQALAQLQQLGQGGMTAQDQATMDAIRRSTAQQAQAQTQSAIQNMAQRGMSGSGNELAAQLAGSQGAADRASNEGMQAAAMAQQRALQAIAQAGQLGGNIRSQDFGQQANIAQAQDAINRFNTENQQAVGMRNASEANRAQQTNLSNMQGLMNQNTGLSNQQQIYNKGLYEQQYNDAMKKAAAAAGAQNNIADTYNKNAEQTQGMFSKTGQGIGGLLSGFAKKKLNPDGSQSTTGSKAEDDEEGGNEGP